MIVDNFSFYVGDSLSVDDIHKGGIYIIRNVVSNKVYVGQTRKPFIWRWRGHERAFMCYANNKYLQNSFNKHGFEAFSFGVLAFLPDDLQEIADRINRKEKPSKKDKLKLTIWLNNKETFWIRYFRKLLGDNNVFNRDDGSGKNPRPDLCEERGKGVKRHYENPGAREKQSAAQQLRYADPSEHRKISEAVRKSITENPERLTKQGNSLKKFYEEDPNRRKIKSEEIKERYRRPGEREKVSICGRKRFSDKNERIRMSLVQKESYRKHPERRLKQSESQKKSWQNPERIEKAKGRKLSQEVYDKVSRKHKENVKNKEMYENVYLKNAVNACQKRTAKYKLLRTCADNALVLLYKQYPYLKKLSVRQKWILINEICDILRSNNEDTYSNNF